MAPPPQVDLTRSVVPKPLHPRYGLPLTAHVEKPLSRGCAKSSGRTVIDRERLRPVKAGLGEGLQWRQSVISLPESA